MGVKTILKANIHQLVMSLEIGTVVDVQTVLKANMHQVVMSLEIGTLSQMVDLFHINLR